MNLPKTYTIEKIADIFEIPEESFEDFLIDFKEFYNVGRNMTDLIYGAAKIIGTTVEVLPQKMVWTDDKRHDVKVTILQKDKL